MGRSPAGGRPLCVGEKNVCNLYVFPATCGFRTVLAAEVTAACTSFGNVQVLDGSAEKSVCNLRVLLAYDVRAGYRG